MSDFFLDVKKLLDMKVEQGLLKQEKTKPLVLMLKKYGIEGMQAISFIADLATVVQQMQQGEGQK